MILTKGEDMVIQVRASLDKVEGFRNESFEPEEILMYLDKAQSRLLDDLVNKNFQQGTLRYEWLRPFLKATTAEDPDWGGGLDPVLLEKTLDLPSDQQYLVSVKAKCIVSGVEGGSFDDGCNINLTTEEVDDTSMIPFPHEK